MSGNEKKTKVKSGAGIRRSRKGKGLPRIMWVAIAVCVIGSVLIFRDQGGDVPTGIGEYQTVVTAPDEETTPPADTTVRSGEVDINDQSSTLTPEEPEPGSTVKPADQASSTPPTKTVTKTKTRTPPPPPIQPAASGPYMVQTGSFGSGANADKEATRLQNLGYDARVKMGNTADDDIIYRVRIGYFKSRAEAETFIRQNRKHMPSAIPAHR
jgi:cell division protein FtsN